MMLNGDETPALQRIRKKSIFIFKNPQTKIGSYMW